MAGSRRLTFLAEAILSQAEKNLDQSVPVLAAVSGGADSAVVAWACREITGQCRAAFVHHQWPASDRMEMAARQVAERLEIRLEVRQVDTSGAGSLEAQARRVRYQVLSEMRHPQEVVVTGHTRTDQAETVVGNLMWGAGLDGLLGIRPHRGWLVRPLLGVGRSQTRELATLLTLPFVDDPANLDHSFRRVRIRQALTVWEQMLGVDSTAKLAELAELATVDIDLLAEQAGAVKVEKQKGAVRLPCGLLRTMPKALAVRAVRRALREINQGWPGSRLDVEKVMAAARVGQAGQLTGGHRVEKRGAYVQVGFPDPSPLPPPAFWDVAEPMRWGDWTLHAATHSAPPPAFPLSAWRQIFSKSAFGSSPVTIRSVTAEDRIRIGKGHKRAGAALAEAKIPPEQREGWPVLEAGGRVLWIPGVRRADEGWVETSNGECLEVSAIREEKWELAES